MSRDATFPMPWRTLAVRGPYTRKRFMELGYPCPEVYGDPAILLPRVYQPPRSGTVHELGIIPHYVDFPQVSAWYANDPRIKVIDVTHPVDQVINQITSCARTVSSSLHGVIVSHAYQIPSRWARFSDGVLGDGVKFLDYFASGGVDRVSPIDIRSKTNIEQLNDQVAEAPMPDLLPLLEPLMAACPFPIVDRIGSPVGCD